MSVKDEFYSLPPEESGLPKETAERRDEENRYEVKSSVQAASIKKENREKQKRNSIKKMLVGALVSVTVITSVAGDDIFYRMKEDTHSESISRYEMYTRMEAGLVGDDDRTSYLTEGYASHSLGVLVSKEPIDLSEPMSLEFDVLQSGYSGLTDGRGSGGISVGFSKYENAQGFGDGGLGYDSEFGVELDLYDDSLSGAEGITDYEGNHISILKSSVWDTIAVTEPMTLDDGSWHHVSIEYRDSVLRVKYDDKNILQGEVENSYKKLYLKIAGSTGDDLRYQAVANIRINGEILLIDDDYAADKVDFNVIKDFNGDNIESESLITGEETGASEPEDTVNPQQDIIGGTTGIGGNNEIDSTQGTEGDRELVEIDCPTCNGTGIICPGSVAADDPEGCHGNVIVDCKACNGTGHEADGRLCSWCNGTLQHMCPSFENHYDCPECNGVGKITGYEEE